MAPLCKGGWLGASRDWGIVGAFDNPSVAYDDTSPYTRDALDAFSA